MTLAVFLAVLLAAFLHAGWNALIKKGTSRLGAMVLVAAVSVPIGSAIAASRPLPDPEVWPWLALSVAIHLCYMTFLARAYDHGDLSRVYPIARGTAPVLVLSASALVLPDSLSAAEIGAIVLMAGGLMLLAHGVFRHNESRRLLPFALATALATAGYTLSDGIGARVAGDAAGYVAWLFILQGTIFTLGVIALRGVRILPATPAGWGLGLLAGLGSYAAYAIAVWAMTVAPIALVAALREVSVLFALLLGRWMFGETLGSEKLLAAALILAGLALSRI